MFSGSAEHRNWKGHGRESLLTGEARSFGQRDKMTGLLRSSFSISIIFFLFVFLPVTVFAESNQTGAVAVEVLNLRQNPTVSSPILVQLSKDTQVLITEIKEDWCRVTVNADGRSLTGWVLGRFISIASSDPQKAEARKDTPRNGVIQQAELRKGTINSSIVNLRSAAGMSASITGKLLKDEIVTILQAQDNWLEVKQQNGMSGWVRMDLVAVDKGNGSPDTGDSNPIERADTSSAGVSRAGVSTNDASTANTISASEANAIGANAANANGASTISIINAGTVSTISTSMIRAISAYATNATNVGTINAAAMNVISAGKINIINTNAISVISVNPAGAGTIGTDPANTSNAGTGAAGSSPGVIGANVEKMIQFAKTLLGIPYVYGGMSTDGFDCSGFTSYVFGAFGIRLERVSSDQAKQGTEVSKENLKPGDLVFFDTSGGHSVINHTGIFIGDGKFIHASSGSSRCVIISDLTTGYYVENYITARCISNTP